MNKKFFFLGGAALLSGAFVALTAFGGVTKAQQLAQIEESVQAQLVTLRDTKTKECEESIAKAANTKAQEMLAAPVQEIAAPVKPGATKPVKPAKKPTKGGSTGSKVDPMPQPAPPAPKTEPQKERAGSAAPEVQKKRRGHGRSGSPEKTWRHDRSSQTRR